MMKKNTIFKTMFFILLTVTLIFSCDGLTGGENNGNTDNPGNTDDPGSTDNPGTVIEIEDGTVEEQGSVSFTNYTGWFEYAYASWNSVSGAASYTVSVKAEGGEYSTVDAQLVRAAGSGYKVDIPGLQGGVKHYIKVQPVLTSGSTGTPSIVSVTPAAHVREGYAFVNGTTTGGYETDGTAAGGTLILYITDATKDTVTASVTKGSSTVSYTGLGAIMNARQSAKSEVKMIVRFMGTVNPPAGVDSMSLMNIKSTKNVTYEGVGSDALLYGWGLNIRDASNIEVRNLAFEEFPDDSVSIQADNNHIWIHHNDFKWGKNGGGDKKKGDGSCDIKDDSTYITVSYNHFHNTGKSSLCGMTSETAGVGFVTYHHNWFDKSGSRHPRVRTITVHVYNNYFDHNYSAGLAATTGASIFVENNYFEDVVRPMISASQGHSIKDDGTDFCSGEDGGVIKEFGNVFTSCGSTVTYYDGDLVEKTVACSGCTYWASGRSTDASVAAKNWPDAYAAASRSETVPSTFKAFKGGAVYNNFDTAAAMYTYAVESPAVAKNNVKQYAGRFGTGTAPDEDEMTDTQKVSFTKNALAQALSGLFYTDKTSSEADVQSVLDDESIISYASVSLITDETAQTITITISSGSVTDTIVIRARTSAEKLAIVKNAVAQALASIVYTSGSETAAAVNTALASVENTFSDVSVSQAVLSGSDGSITVTVSCGSETDTVVITAPSASERVQITRDRIVSAVAAISFTVEDTAEEVLAAVETALSGVSSIYAYLTSASAAVVDGNVVITITTEQDETLTASITIAKPTDAAYAAAAKTAAALLAGVAWNTDVQTTVSSCSTALQSAADADGLYGAVWTVTAGTGAQESKAVVTLTYGTASETIWLSAFTGYQHSFSSSGLTSEFFTISGNTSTSKGSVVYNGISLATCLKMESATVITFSNPLQETLKLTLVFGGSTSAIGKTVKIDGTSYTVTLDSSSNQTVVADIAPGSHTVTKGDSINLFYMDLNY